MSEVSKGRTTNPLGYALATGVLVRIKGWVWCEAPDTGVFRPRPKEHTICCDEPCMKGWDDPDHAAHCPGPHKPMYVHNRDGYQPLEGSDE